MNKNKNYTIIKADLDLGLKTAIKAKGNKTLKINRNTKCDW